MLKIFFWMSVASRKFMYRDSRNLFDTKTDFILGILGFKGLVLTERQILFIGTEITRNYYN